MTYVVTSKGDCIASNSLPIQHLRSEQEEADTRMLLHALNATQRGATSITIQSPDTDVLVLTLWVYKRLCPDTTVIVGTGGKRKSIPLGPLYEAVGEELVKLPQGSCLGPVLFTVYTSKLFDIVSKHLPSVNCYADDTQLYLTFSPGVQGEDEGALNAMRYCLHDLRNWVIEDRLMLNDDI